MAIDRCSWRPSVVLCATIILASGCSSDPTAVALESGTAEFPEDDFAFTYEGQRRGFRAVFRDRGGNALSPTVTWGSSRPEVIAIDPSTGIATAVSEGAATISAAAGNTRIEREVTFDQEAVITSPGLRIETRKALSEAAYGGYSHISGDVVITNADLSEVDGLGALRVVEGNFTIDATNLTNLDGLARLERVGGTLTVRGSGSLADLGAGFRSLTEVGGDLIFEQLHELTSLASMERLTRVGGTLILSDLPALVSSEFPRLEDVDAGIYAAWVMLPAGSPFLPALKRTGNLLFPNGPVERLELPSLEVVRGGFTVGDEVQEGGLGAVSVPALRCIEGFFRLAHVTSLEAPALEVVGGSCTPDVVLPPPAENVEDLRVIRVCSNPFLPSLSLPSLRSAASVDICSNAALETLELPLLEFVEKDFSVRGTPLSHLSAPVLGHVGRDFTLTDNPVRWTDLPKLSRVGGTFLLQGGDLEELSAPMLERVGHASVPYSGLLVTSSDALRRISMPALREAEKFEIWLTPSLAELEFPSLERATTLIVQGPNELNGVLGFPNLEEVGFLQVADLPALVDISMPLLRSVQQLSFRQLPQLDSLFLPSFEEAGGISIGDNDALEDIEMPSLRRVSYSLVLDGNRRLTHLDGFSALTHRLVVLSISGHPLLTSVSGLYGIGAAEGAPPAVQDLTIIQNPSLPSALVDEFVEHLRARFGGSDGISGSVDTRENGG